MKIAPIFRVLQSCERVAPRLIHTGQHYDTEMNGVFFDELGIPPPDVTLNTGGGSITVQVAKIMLALEPVFAASPQPDAVLVVGDVNSTLAAAMVAVRLAVPVVHVEAGLRSRDLSMPEEINRLLTDRLSSLLLTSERSAIGNLEAEGISGQHVQFVGNVMIDSLMDNAQRSLPAAQTLTRHGAPADFLAAAAKDFGFVTLHRPANVDDPAQLSGLLWALVTISQSMPLIFALHPRTRGTLDKFGLHGILTKGRILVTPPLGYLEAVGLMKDAKFVVTDSGGVQEETTALGVPCLTVRDNTERPVTVSEGTNTLVGRDPKALAAAALEVVETGGKAGRIPALWDGKAAARIVNAVTHYLELRHTTSAD